MRSAVEPAETAKAPGKSSPEAGGKSATPGAPTSWFAEDSSLLIPTVERPLVAATMFGTDPATPKSL